jgi:site-specific DNA-methyltransferase (adenine-specific)
MDKMIKEGRKVDLIVTDPPYDIKNTNSGSKTKLSKRIQSQQDALVELDITKSIDYSTICSKFLKLQDKVNMYIWCNKAQIPFYLDFFVTSNECSFDIIKWVKTNPVPAYNNKYVTDTEYCLYFRKGGLCMPSNMDDAKTLYTSPINKKDKDKYGHPTIKPLPIIKKLIRNSTKEGDVVFDPFMGSGTTGEASKEEKRGFIGVELTKKYYEIAKERINRSQTDLFDNVYHGDHIGAI